VVTVKKVLYKPLSVGFGILGGLLAGMVSSRRGSPLKRLNPVCQVVYLSNR
jgi:hypothetical protein